MKETLTPFIKDGKAVVGEFVDVNNGAVLYSHESGYEALSSDRVKIWEPVHAVSTDIP